MSVQNPERVVTKQDLADFYAEILPYLGGSGGGGSTELPMVSSLPTPSSEYNGKRVIYVGANDTTNDLYQGIMYECRIDIDGETWKWFFASNNIINSYFRWVDPVDCDVTMSISGNDNPMQRAKIKIKTDSSPTSGSANFVNSGGIYTALSNKQDKLAYSTSEKAIGTWTNGSTLYQRTFTGTLSSSTSTTVTTALSNYTVRDIAGVIRTGKQTITCNITLVSGSTVLYAAAFMDGSGNVLIYTNNSSLYGSAYELTIKYTK